MDEKVLRRNLMYETPFAKIETVMYNDAIDVCSRACASCYKTKLPDEYEKKAKYISARTKVGHDSVTEHSNLVIQIIFKDNILSIKKLVDMLIGCKYLNMLDFDLPDLKRQYQNPSIIIGGSLRGFKHLIKDYLTCINPLTPDTSNIYIDSIIEYFLNIWPEYKCFFEDIDHPNFVFDKPRIKDKPLRWSKIKDNITDESKEKINKKLREYCGVDSTKYPEIVDITGSFDNERLNLPYYDEDFMSLFNCDLLKMLKFSTITVRFVNMSRTCTHQLVRHRNAITQQSQRYVDASDTSFTIPTEDPETLNKIVTVNGVTGPFSEVCIDLYKQSLNNYKDLLASGISKEDARSVLCSNVNCEEIYVTFTLPNLLKFIELRSDSHAQSEIRKYATALKDVLFPKY